MSHPDYQEFTPLHTDAEIAPSATALGVTVHEPAGIYSYWPEGGQIWKSIGHITVHHGVIELWPFRDLSRAETGVLDDCGVDAIAHPPTEGTSWVCDGEGRWHCDISILPGEDDPFLAQVQAHERLVIRRPARQWQGAA